MTFFIGLDLSKFKHDCFIMNERGEVVRNSFSFSNNREGFNLPDITDLISSYSLKLTAIVSWNSTLFLSTGSSSLNPFAEPKLTKWMLKRLPCISIPGIINPILIHLTTYSA